MADSTEYQIVPEAAEATATEDPPSSYTACHNHGSDVQVLSSSYIDTPLTIV
jgi:zinc transporter 1/2/3